MFDTKLLIADFESHWSKHNAAEWHSYQQKQPDKELGTPITIKVPLSEPQGNLDNCLNDPRELFESLFPRPILYLCFKLANK